MPNFWSEATGERYVKAKASALTDYLRDKEILEDDPWASIEDIQKELVIPEFHAFGILIYLWIEDAIKVRPDEDGKLRVRIV